MSSNPALAIVREMATTTPHDGDGFCHHCGCAPLRQRDLDDPGLVDGRVYVVEDEFIHRPYCLWVRARAVGRTATRQETT